MIKTTHWAGWVTGLPDPVPGCCCSTHAGEGTCRDCPRHSQRQLTGEEMDEVGW